MGASVSSQHREEAALLEACAENDVDAVRDFIAAGRVDIDCFDDEGSTPLHVASWCGHVELLKMLLATSKGALEAAGQLGGTPLHVAATAKRQEVVRLLLAANASVDALDESGLQPLHRAAAAGDADVVDLLLGARAVVDAVTTDDAYTPLHVAAMRVRIAVIERLVAAGAATGACTAAGETAAVLFARHAAEADASDKERIQALLEHTSSAPPSSAPPSPPASPPASAPASVPTFAPASARPSPPCALPSAELLPPPQTSTCQCASSPPALPRLVLSQLPSELLAEILVRAGAPRAALALGSCSHALRTAVDCDATWQAIFALVWQPALCHCFGATAGAECDSGGGLANQTSDAIVDAVPRRGVTDEEPIGQASSGGDDSASDDARDEVALYPHASAAAPGGIAPHVGPPISRPATGEGWRAYTLRFCGTWAARAKARGVIVLLLHGHAYDVTHFVDEHPGDEQLLTAAGGRDASEAFEYVGHSQHAHRMLRTFAAPELDQSLALYVAHQRELRAAARSRDDAFATGGGGGSGSDADVSPSLQQPRPIWSSIVVRAQRWYARLSEVLAAANEGSSMRRGTAASLLE